MIVITTPTGQIGSQVLTRLLPDRGPLRVIVRDPAKLPAAVREGVDVIEGSHDDPGVLDQALAGADALFWLVPPDPRVPSAREHYLTFTQAGASAIRRHSVGHVVAATSAGHGWREPAGLLSAAFAMDAELELTGAAYRGLSMPFYMENLLRHLQEIRAQGTLSLPYTPDRPLALVATPDVAQVAAALLTDRSWRGQEHLPLFSPDHLTPVQMAHVMSEVLHRPVTYHQTTIEETASRMSARGLPEQAIHDLTDMHAAQNRGLYDADWAGATPTPTTFRSWLRRVLDADPAA